MAEEHDPFAAQGDEEEESLIMAPLLVAKLQVSWATLVMFPSEKS
jgi:hypothetical protein